MRNAVLLLCSLLLGACAYDAPRLEPERAVPVETSEKGLWQISDKSEDALAMSGLRVRNPALEHYLDEVGCRIAGDFCDSIRVYPVAAPDFNASMSPNGFMQVWTGLLLRVENEAQLAAVLGHEVAHYVERHSLERLETTRRTANALLALQFGLVVGGITGVQAGPVSFNVGDLTGLAATGYLAAYSREHESASDLEGLERMEASGYEPREAAKVWQHLVSEQEECDLRRPAALLASHPASEDRLQTLESLAVGKKTGDAGEQRFLQVMQPLRSSWLRAELALRRYCRVGVIIERLLQQGANPGELYYFQGEIHRLRSDEEENDLDLAIETYRKAIGMEGAPVQAHRALGLVLWRKGQRQDARTAFEQYLAAAGNPDDAAMIRHYLEQLR